MANLRTLQTSFNGGEICPEMFGQITDAKYRSGLSTCRNFIVKPQGPVENRPGFSFIREVKDSAKKTRLIPFTYSTDQTMVIEVGAGYFRFHTHGGTLLAGWAPYEVANSYSEADLFDIHFVQSADVLTLVHPNYRPAELRRLGAITWEFKEIVFTFPVDPPTGLSASSHGFTTAKYTYSYVVTAVSSDGNGESPASVWVSIDSNLFETGCVNVLNWAAVSGAGSYNIYKAQGGLYGYIGKTANLTFADDNIAPDLSKTPPLYEVIFNAPGDYPGAVSYFEQRRSFAGTVHAPQTIWMTKSGTESNMSYSVPVRDDDRISFRVAGREANTIRHIVPLAQLLLLTSSGEWRVTSVNSDAITPTSISVRPQSYVGASNVQPVTINNACIYCASRGGHIRELAYSWQANGFVTGDLSLRSTHLFDNLSIVDMAYSKAPQPIVWFVSSSGRLLGLTYIPEQQIGAWHWHDTDGVFESCTVVAEGSEDVLYCVVRRTINGQTKRYVERMETRQFASIEDAFFVDSGATYSGLPALTITGLGHLEGKTVNILADGAVHPQRIVVNGAVSLDNPAKKVTVGLPITSDIVTLPFSAMFQDGSGGQGHTKNVNKAWLRVHRSSGIFVGPGEDRLTEAKQRTLETYGSPPKLKSDEIQVVVSPSWGASGQIMVRQKDPLPLTLVSLTLEVSIGG